MRLSGLRAFRYVYEAGSISAAARRLNLSQPAVSRLLSSLEERLAMALFFRRGRTLVPTPEGERFYAQTHRLLASIDDLPRIAQDIRDGSRTRIRLLAMPRIANEVALPIVARLHKKLPNIEIQLDIIPRRDMEVELKRLTYDFAIVTLPITSTMAMIEPTSVQRLYVVTHRDHHLAGAAELQLPDLVAEKIAGLPTYTRHRQEMDDLFSSFSADPRIVVTVSSIEAAIDLVARGVGVTFADGIMRRAAEARDCVMIPLTPTSSVTYALIRPPISATTPGLDALEALLRQRFEELRD